MAQKLVANEKVVKMETKLTVFYRNYTLIALQIKLCQKGGGGGGGSAPVVRRGYATECPIRMY